MNLNGAPAGGGQPPSEPLEQAGEPSLWRRLRLFIKSSFSQRPLISWLLAVAVVLVLYLRVAEPLAQWAAETRQQAAGLVGSLAGLEAMAQREEARLQKLLAQRESLQALAESLPAGTPEKAQAELAAEAKKLAESQGLKVASSLFLEPKPQGAHLRIALRLIADGGYDQVRGFLAAFPQTPGFMAPASFSVAPSPEAPGRLRLECEVITFLRRQP